MEFLLLFVCSRICPVCKVVCIWFNGGRDGCCKTAVVNIILVGFSVIVERKFNNYGLKMTVRTFCVMPFQYI